VIAGKGNMSGSAANRLTNQSGGVEGDTLGAAGGAETHTLTTAQMPAHNHPAPPAITIQSGSGVTVRDNTGTGAVTGSTGGGAAHNNVQPTLILNKIVKL
jgi:microcystin-dependent protein